MKKLNNTFLIDKHDEVDINSVLENIFSCKDSNSMFSNIYKIIEWEMSEWFVKKGVKQKKEDFYIYVETLPDFFMAYTVENEKYLRISVKHKIKADKDGYKKIKSRFIIKNFKPSYKSIVNNLNLIKIINYMELSDVPNAKLMNININTEVNLFLPSKEEFETYLIDMFNAINEKLKLKLTSTNV
jgi:hypothetical protein